MSFGLSVVSKSNNVELTYPITYSTDAAMAPTVHHILLLSTKGQNWTHYIYVCACTYMHACVCAYVCAYAHHIPRQMCGISFLIPLFMWISKIKLRSPDFYLCWLLSQLTSPDTVCAMHCPCTKSLSLPNLFFIPHVTHRLTQVARFIQNHHCGQAEVKCEHMGYDSSSASATAQESMRAACLPTWEPCSLR